MHLLESALALAVICIERRFDSGLASVWVLFCAVLVYIFRICGVGHSWSAIWA